MYPLEAKSDTRIEQAASTEVMPAAVPSIVFFPVLLHLNTPYLYPIIDAMVSPIPKLRIPAKGASGRSFNPDDIHLGSAQPNKSEKWLKTPIILGLSYRRA
jgi:hypothetical protein